MRTVTWLLTPILAFALAACGDDKSETETDATTTNNLTTTATNPTTTTDGTTNPTTTTDPGTTDLTTSTDPGTTDATTTTDPGTTDPTTSTDPTTDGTTDGTTGEPNVLSCESYCALYETGCKDFNEYDNNQACLDQCKQWPAGLPNETAGDSLGCRTYHVTVANMADPDVHCPHAGPSGAMTCVDPDAPKCEDYCTTYFANCTMKLNLYKDIADCNTQCADWYPGTADQTAGDTVGCREYHAGVAIGDPDTHCPHAGPGGADVCVTP